MGFLATSASVVSPGYLVVADERLVPAGKSGLFQDVDHPQVQIRAVVECRH